MQTAHKFAEELLALARKSHNREYLLEAHFALGYILYLQGLFVPAHEHWEQGATLYDAQQHRPSAFTYGIDPGVHCLGYTAEMLGYFGYLDQSVARKHDALALAQELLHPYSFTQALLRAANVHQLRREWRQTQDYAEAAIALATEQGFMLYIAAGTIVRSWASAMQGRGEESIAQMHQALAAHRATRSVLVQSRNLVLLAEMYGNIRLSEEGLACLSEALVLMNRTGEQCYEAELHRLKGELLLQQSLARIIHQPKKSIRESTFGVKTTFRTTASQDHHGPQTSSSDGPGTIQLVLMVAIRRYASCQPPGASISRFAREPTGLSIELPGPARSGAHMPIRSNSV